MHWECWASQLRAANYWHMFPSSVQARRAIWDGVNPHTGKKILHEIFPKELIVGTNGTEMKVELKSGAIWNLVGSDNFDSLVGSPPAGVVFSEWSLANPAAWDFVRPILVENGGWALFIYTPRGHNHGYRMYEMARNNPDWFCQRLTVDDTHILSPEAIQAERDAGMSEAMVQQEFYCSFESPIDGAYYAEQMSKADKEGRIGNVPYDPAAPVETWWDLGIHDSTSIWFVQPVGRELHAIEYYENSGEALSHYIGIVKNRAQEKGYNYSTHYLPHDVKARELIAGKSRESVLRANGIRPKVGKALDVMDGINTVRSTLNRMWFDAKLCSRGVDALKSYRKEEDDKKSDGITKFWKPRPLHDWSCLTGDTKVLTRYGTYQIMNLPETGEVLTTCGFSQYHSPRVTRVSAPLVAVTFKDGLTVKCTPEHRFLTESGWRLASDLQTTMLIQSSSIQLQRILTVASIASTRVRDIGRRVAASFTEMFGPPRLALSQMGATSTTRTATRRTTSWPTLNASQLKSTLVGRGTTPRKTGLSAFQYQLERKQPLGTGRTQADFGIEGTRNALRAGPSGSAKRLPVEVAETNSWVWYVKAAIAKSIARMFVRPRLIATVEPLSERADVWCLTVPGVEMFALENGAMVHNSHSCDAMRTGIVGRKEESSGPSDVTYPRGHVSRGVV